jgi:CRISPR-associated protein Csy2
MHALERKLHATEFSEIKLTGLIVSCLDINLQTYKGRGDYVSSIVATSNPLDKSGKRPSFIEEARCDLEVTLAIECEIKAVIDDELLVLLIDNILHTMKIASGDITHFKPSRHIEVDNDDPKKITRYLMPGFCLVSRQELMQEAMLDDKDAIDAMLDYLKITTDVEIDDKHKVTKSKSSKKEKGWIVPIAIGYQGISNLGHIKNSRDENTPHRFAESMVTLGEFKMPYHFDTLDEMMWRYQIDKERDFYLCQNNYSVNNQESKL